MAQNGYGAAPVAGHVGRIPNFGKTQVNPMGNYEPPACIQNAMMTKDKKPFTYTPGGLDLSQIRTPSMARRMARQRSQEEHEQAYPQQHQANGGGHHQPQGGSVPPPPPPPIPAPPPPPALVIEVPKTKSPKPVPMGERPEIVIPENPIGMLRKTNSPYHWEAEKAEMEKLGNVPKFMEKVPSPLTVKMPPSSFSQQPPQNYTPQNNFQRQNYPYQTAQSPESPIHRPEAQYAHQKSASPIVNTSPQTRETLVRQDSQFNKSPQPFAGQSPISNCAPYSPSPNNNWRQPEKRDSPSNNVSNSPQSPPFNRDPTNNQQYSPSYQNQFSSPNAEPVFHTLPRVGQRTQGNVSNKPINNNVLYNNIRSQSPKSDNYNTAPWRSNTLNRQSRGDDNQKNIGNNNNNNQQQVYSPPWNVNEGNNNNRGESEYSHPWKQENRNTVSNQQPQQQYTPPWVRSDQDLNNNRVQENNNMPRAQDNLNTNRAQPVSPPYTQEQNQPRYQSTMSIPVTPRKQNPQPEYNRPAQKEVVYVNEEPVYYCPESPKSIPPWVKTQKEKTKTPPPAWCQRPLEGRKSAPRELTTPPRDANQEPEWIKKREEIRGGREVVSPPKYQQPVQPNWSTRPSENKKPENASQGSRVIPIQVEIDQGRQESNQPPHLRLVIDMQPGGNQSYSQPTQRIMRVLSPQLVRLDDAPSQHELPTLNRSVQSQDSQPKTRIIPIQIEGGNGGANKRVYYHKFTQEGPPRQSKAFKVLQIITGTEDGDDNNMQIMENQHGFTDL